MTWSPQILRESSLSRFQLLGGLVVLLVAMVAYSFSGFLLDDTLHLAGITTHTGLDALSYSIEPDQLDLHLPGGAEQVKFEYFRPLTSLSLRIDHLLFGLRPFGFHLVNLLLHLVNVGLVFSLGHRLGLYPGPAWAAALVWGVSVPAGLAAGWISGRSEILAAACILGALQSVLRHRESGSGRWLAAASLLLVMGTLAKESAAVGLGLVHLFLLLDGRRRPGPQFALWFPVLAVLLVRAFLVGLPRVPAPYFQPPDSLATAYVMLLKTVIYLLGGLTGLPVIPFLQVEKLQAHPTAILAAILVAALGIRILLRCAPRPKGIFLGAWFLVALLPALFVMAFSFYLYLPLVGLCWLLALAWQSRPSLLIKSWIIWLMTVGVLINVALGASLVHLGNRAEEARIDLDDILATSGARDIVILDAPFWSYALPVSTRLVSPGREFQTYFLNFSPFLVPGTPATVTWTGDDEFNVAMPGRRFFTAPIERFFLFGRDPCRGSDQDGVYSLTCLGLNPDNPYPTSLRATLDRSTAGPDLLLLRFEGWRLKIIQRPAAAGSPTPPTQ